MIRVDRSIFAFALALLGFGVMAPQEANAYYLYTFRTGFGLLQFTTESIIPDPSPSVPVDWWYGSGTLDEVSDDTFTFRNGETSYTTPYQEFIFTFSPFPDSTGEYVAEYADLTPPPPPYEYEPTEATLSIASIPEPSTWALAAIGFLSLAALARWRRRDALARGA